MTQLLVSVRSCPECALALDACVDVIDIKEPTRGSLGAADATDIARIVQQVGGRRPVSVALGELRGLDMAALADLPHVEYVKIGLADCANWPAWPAKWQAAWKQVPGNPHRVAVTYADAARANSPECGDVLDVARHAGCDVLLVDTFDKSSGGLLDWYSLSQLEHLREVTRARDMQLALAGSLTSEQIPRLIPLQPDFVAVRTAVCHRGRAGILSRERIERLMADMRLAIDASAR